MNDGRKSDLVSDLHLRAVAKTRLDSAYTIRCSIFTIHYTLKASGYKTERFVSEKTMPELYEIVQAYKPVVMWSDGEWEALDTYWNSTIFLAWLYNESPVKETVVTNDRWGSNTMCKHGDYYTCGYKFNAGVLQKHKWENCMTIDLGSWGFRRNMVSGDVISMADLLRSWWKSSAVEETFWWMFDQPAMVTSFQFSKSLFASLDLGWRWTAKPFTRRSRELIRMTPLQRTSGTHRRILSPVWMCMPSSCFGPRWVLWNWSHRWLLMRRRFYCLDLMAQSHEQMSSGGFMIAMPVVPDSLMSCRCENRLWILPQFWISVVFSCFCNYFVTAEQFLEASF